MSEEIIKLISVITKLPESRITLEADLFTDLGVDSLLGVTIFAALDKKYGIEVPEDKLRDISKVKDLVALVAELRGEKDR